MIDHGKKNILGVLINAVDYEYAVGKIISAAQEKKSFSVSALAVHGVMTGVQDNEHRYRLNHFDLVLPDGQPVRWALNLLYNTKLKDRVYGPTLTLKVCEKAEKENLSLFLYGSKQQVLEKFSANLKHQFPGLIISGMMPSRFRNISEIEKTEIVEHIKSSGADIVLVGLGCPRQEVWVYEHIRFLKMPLLAVGAAFDFHAKLLPQSPELLQRLGLEWLYRLFQEPKRLWKRYLFLNPQYVFMILQQVLNHQRFDSEQAIEPLSEIRYG